MAKWNKQLVQNLTTDLLNLGYAEKLGLYPCLHMRICVCVCRAYMCVYVCLCVYVYSPL